MVSGTKKALLLICSTTLVVTVLGYTLVNSNAFNLTTRANAQDHSNSCYFNHYEAVEPTEDCHGSKEFWACCAHMSFLLEEPGFGTIHDAGSFTGIYFDTLNESDVRYIPALPKTRIIKFYCDDLLIDTQFIKDGNKLETVSSDDFVISGWYKEKELINSWDFVNDTVDGDTNLYASYAAKNKSFSVDESNALEVDSYGFSATTELEKEICVSKGTTPTDSFAVLQNRGILFNKSEIGLISKITIDIDSENFESIKIYYGNTPLSFSNHLDLSSGINNIDLSGAEYFTVQNSGEEDIKINSVNIEYVRKTIFIDTNIPTVAINTENFQTVTSRTTYVDCNVSTIGAEKDVTELKAQIKVRGNSTSTLPKKPYRIKLDKKSSLFGYEKAKNWVLLADYMDGSNMHNYTALKFSELVRNNNSFSVKPLHVNLLLNGDNMGLYLFCEHIDAKEGRLNIEQDEIWKMNFEQINFYIERDSSTIIDPEEIENVTYFVVPLDNYEYSRYVFALKYPEKDDFIEEKENGEVDLHEEEFQRFFDSLKEYITGICNEFVFYSNNRNGFSRVASLVDIDSLAEYAVVDQAFMESDHSQKSFKMYRKNGGLLKFGPNWDYDSCAYGLPFQGSYVLNPFEDGNKTFTSKYFGEKWGNTLYYDDEHGRQYLANVWDSIGTQIIDNFISSQLLEMQSISNSTIFDCEKWMHNQYYCVFDNQLYYWNWISTELYFLKAFYS